MNHSVEVNAAFVTGLHVDDNTTIKEMMEIFLEEMPNEFHALHAGYDLLGRVLFYIAHKCGLVKEVWAGLDENRNFLFKIDDIHQYLDEEKQDEAKDIILYKYIKLGENNEQTN